MFSCHIKSYMIYSRDVRCSAISNYENNKRNAEEARRGSEATQKGTVYQSQNADIPRGGLNIPEMLWDTSILENLRGTCRKSWDVTMFAELCCPYSLTVMCPTLLSRGISDRARVTAERLTICFELSVDICPQGETQHLVAPISCCSLSIHGDMRI